MLEESKVLITSVQELLDSVREEEKKALAAEQLAMTRKFEEDRLKQSREFDKEKLALEKDNWNSRRNWKNRRRQN